MSKLLEFKPPQGNLRARGMGGTTALPTSQYLGGSVMSERYYVVSESELKRLATAWCNAGACHYDYHEEAEAACRARPVPQWATHFARACPRNFEELVFDSSEVIKR